MLTPAITGEQLQQVQATLHRMCSHPDHRRDVLDQLLSSVEVANRLAPESWGVTQFAGGFRLNVGPVEAYACIDGVARLLLACQAEDVVSAGVRSIRYQSLPAPQSVFVGTPEEFSRVRDDLWGAHRRYLELAALTADGRPRKCSYARFHSPAVLEYARLASKADGGILDELPKTAPGENQVSLIPRSHGVQRLQSSSFEEATLEEQALAGRTTGKVGQTFSLDSHGSGKHAAGNPYNGYAWQERMAKYDEMRRRFATGALGHPRGPCRVCGDPGDGAATVEFEYHDEDYSQEYSWAEPAAFVVCRSCHRRLHLRFAQPDGWRSFLAHVRRGGYARDLERQPLVRAELDCYRQAMRAGLMPPELRPLRTYRLKIGKEWFAGLSLEWGDMLRSESRPRP